MAFWAPDPNGYEHHLTVILQTSVFALYLGFNFQSLPLAVATLITNNRYQTLQFLADNQSSSPTQRNASMELTAPKPNPLSNVFVRLLSFGVLVILARFAYVITVRGNTCDTDGNFCFFPETLRFSAISTTDFRFRDYYSTVFQDLINEGFLSPDSNSLCIETLTGQDVAALRDIGVTNSIGISKKSSPPLVKKGSSSLQPFDDDTFDFEFSGVSGLERTNRPVEFASEVSRTLKLGGFFVVHTVSKDQYSLNSLLELFNSCRLIRSRLIDGVDSSSALVREIVLRKETGKVAINDKEQIVNGTSGKKHCHVSEYKKELIRNAEPFIQEEPLKPWIVLKKNLRTVKYLSSMVDIRFKNRYVYVDVGARNYGSSIGGWFRKIYPKQNKAFEIYAIEADKAFHDEYKLKKSVTLIPYAAWLRNETLFFEINREPNRKNMEKGRGMGRIQAAQSSSDYVGDYDKIQGFDFASWLKSSVSKRDYVVVKMDVEGTEFHLIPRLVETGAICLIDEMFLECHYNRWQRCCPGLRSRKYQKTYKECLDLFHYLRESGVLVHQWL